MLAALAGFESKTDKYVMQRLLRAGDINAKNREVFYSSYFWILQCKYYVLRQFKDHTFFIRKFFSAQY